MKVKEQIQIQNYSSRYFLVSHEQLFSYLCDFFNLKFKMLDIGINFCSFLSKLVSSNFVPDN